MTNEDKIPGKEGWTGSRPKRFYTDVSVVDAESGFGVLLDARPIKTPLKQSFVVPTRGLAEAVADEWRAQEDYVIAATMPLLKLANTAIDQAEHKLPEIVEEFVSYSGSDLLCYRADTPEGLVARQEAHWDPLLTWAARELGAGFVVTQGIIHQAQPDTVLAAVKTWAGKHDRFAMTALQGLTALTGSAVIAMALSDGEVSAEDAWAAANVDEDWQIELWGRDEEAERVRAGRHREFEAGVEFLRLLGG